MPKNGYLVVNATGTAIDTTGHGPRQLYLIVDPGRRRLLPGECWRVRRIDFGLELHAEKGEIVIHQASDATDALELELTSTAQEKADAKIREEAAKAEPQPKRELTAAPQLHEGKREPIGTAPSSLSVPASPAATELSLPTGEQSGRRGARVTPANV